MGLQRFLFLGLGNPGKRYEGTRHNFGFDWLDRLLLEWAPGTAYQERFKSHWISFEKSGFELHFLKPQTFMNLSGEALSAWRAKYQGDYQICIFLDDLDIELGRLRLRPQGSDGGHKGLRSLIQHAGHDTLPRLRIGVGRESDGRDVSEHVLEKFSPAEQKIVDQILSKAPELSQKLLEDTFEKAMNVINSFRVSEI